LDYLQPSLSRFGVLIEDKSCPEKSPAKGG